MGTGVVPWFLIRLVFGPNQSQTKDSERLPGCRIGIGHSGKHNLDRLFRRLQISSENSSFAMNSETNLYKENIKT